MDVLLVEKAPHTYPVDDCIVIEDSNPQVKAVPYQIAKCEDSIFVDLVDSSVQEKLLVQDDCIIEGIYNNSEEVNYNGEVCIISEKSLSSHISLRSRLPSDDCIIVCDDSPIQYSTDPAECIIIDDNLNIDESLTTTEEWIVIDDQDVEDITVTEHLLPNMALISKAFLYAKIGHVNGIKRLCQSGLNLNCKNSRRWSLLMMASFAGSPCVVRYLLSKKVDFHVKDKRNNTAHSLAKEKGNKKILAIFRMHQRLNSLRDFFCEDCKKIISHCSKRKHRVSLEHQRNMSPVKPHESFHISTDNIGYQMLLKCGWDEKHGLGKNLQGNKFPIVADTKNNRLGLGHENHPKTAKLKHKLSSLESNMNGFFCEVCNENVRKCYRKTHELSIIHQSNVIQHQPSDTFHISPKNVGYQMLLKCGWDEKNGLGKNSQGNIFPITTEIKNNRLGLGHENVSIKSRISGLKIPKLKKQKLLKQKRSSFFCEVCDENIVQCSRKKHELSNIHQSKVIPPQTDNSFHITPKNIGYQMLLKCGWDEKNGLGKNLQGDKFPITTETKNNRLGLGHKNITKKSKTLRSKIPKLKNRILRQRFPTLQSVRLKSVKNKKDKMLQTKLDEKNKRIFYRLLLK